MGEAQELDGPCALIRGLRAESARCSREFAHPASRPLVRRFVARLGIEAQRIQPCVELMAPHPFIEIRRVVAGFGEVGPSVLSPSLPNRPKVEPGDIEDEIAVFGVEPVEHGCDSAIENQHVVEAEAAVNQKAILRAEREETIMTRSSAQIDDVHEIIPETSV